MASIRNIQIPPKLSRIRFGIQDTAFSADTSPVRLRLPTNQPKPSVTGQIRDLGRTPTKICET